MAPNLNSPAPLITAIVPIDDARNGLDNLLTWMQKSDLTNFQVITILDTDSPQVHQTVLDQQRSNPHYNILVVESHGRNPGASRNIGINLAKGEWICFWDSDDLPNPSGFIEMAEMGALEESELVVGQYVLVKKEYEKKSEIQINTSSLEQLYRNPGLWRILFKREEIRGIEFPELSMAEDQIFIFRVLKKNPRISYYTNPVYQYFKYPSGQLTRNPSKFDDLRIALGLISDSLIENNYFRNFIKLRLARSCVRNGNTKTKFFGLKTYLDLKFDYLLLKIRREKQVGNSTRSIFVPLTGGLGNQLFQLAAAFHFDNHSEIKALPTIGKPRVRDDGQVEVASLVLPSRINILRDQKQNEFVTKCFGYLLRSGITPSKLEEARIVRWASLKAGELVFSIYLRKLIRIKVARDVGYNQDLSVSSRNTLLIGYFQSYKYVSDSFIQNMELSGSKKFEEIEQMREESEKRSPLVVHVRLGDYRLDSTLGVLDESYYKLNVSSEWGTGRYQQVWLFSDEPDAAILRIPEELRQHTVIFKPSEWNTSETLILMSMGCGFVLANSSFSWWAARLSLKSKNRVIVPMPWFTGRKSPNELNSPLWKTFPRKS